MAAPTNTTEALEQNALGPHSVTVGNQSVTQKSADDLIKLDRYLASKTAATAGPKGFGLRFQKLIPPGGG
jgi:hypothetical protein